MALALMAVPLLASRHVKATDTNNSQKHIWLYPIIRGEKIGLIDVEGRQVIGPVYDTLSGYSIENFPKFPRVPDIIWQWRDWEPLEIENPEQLIIGSTNGRWGFLNSDGSMAIPQTFERVRNFGFKVKLAPVKTDGLWGYIDRNGKISIEPQFDDAYPFYGNQLAAVRKGKLWGLIAPDGSWVVSPQLEEQPRPNSEKPFPVKMDGKWGFMDQQGKIVIPPRFTAITMPYGFSEGLANVQLDNKMGFIDYEGNFLIKPIFDVASPFLNGIASVSSEDYCGYIDHSGQFIVPMNKYNRCLPFRSQLTVVSRKDFGKLFTKRVQIPKWGYINRTGQEIVPLNLDSADEFHDGLAAVEKDGLGGYIDEHGEFVIKLGHADIKGGRAFSGGLAPACTGRILRWGYIDTSGSWVIAPDFKDANIFRGQLAFVEKRNSVGYVNRQGRLVFEIDTQDIGR